jgi:hypothetical protein
MNSSAKKQVKAVAVANKPPSVLIIGPYGAGMYVRNLLSVVYA